MDKRVDICKQSNNVDDILNAITVYLQDTKDDKVLNNDFKSLLKEVKYYTHKSIMMLSPSWHLVKYKNNVCVIDSLEAGHFKDFTEFINCHGKCLKDISVLIRPGIYVGTHVLTNATIDIVGDCNTEINPTTKAIDKDPTVIFTNILLPTAMNLPRIRGSSTFHFIDSEVSLKQISVSGEIACQHTDIKLLECSFVSKYSSSLYCYESSNLNCKRCRCVEGFDGVFIKKSHAIFTSCFISEIIGGQGIVAKDDTEMISLKQCTITKCKKQGLLIYNGVKVAKIIDSYFEDNASDTTESIHLKVSRVLVKNTTIRNRKSIDIAGIYIEGGSGKFDNVVIEKFAMGMIVQATVEIKNCIIHSCSMSGIFMNNFVKGAVILENNSITKCPVEIARPDDSPMPTCKGENKHAIFTYPSINVENENIFKEMRMSRKKGCIDTNIQKEYSEYKFCDSCGMHELDSQRLCKTLKACGKCKMVYYCSSICQQKRWKYHKLQCEIFVKTKIAAREKTKANKTNEEGTIENKKSDFKTEAKTIQTNEEWSNENKKIDYKTEAKTIQTNEECTNEIEESNFKTEEDDCGGHSITEAAEGYYCIIL